MHSFCENRLVALIWRLAGLSIGTYGLILMLQASSVKQQLCYFTNQSNLFILILFLLRLSLSVLCSHLLINLCQ